MPDWNKLTDEQRIKFENLVIKTGNRVLLWCNNEPIIARMEYKDAVQLADKLYKKVIKNGIR